MSTVTVLHSFARKITCTRWAVLQVLMLACLFVTVGARDAAHAVEQRLKSKLGCVPFVAANIEAMAFTEYLTTVLLNELERTGTFEVAERKRLEAAMDLEGVRSDVLGQRELQRLGGRLGVEFLVSGSVLSQAQGMQLDLQLLNLRGQRTVLQEKLRLSEADAPRILQELAIRIRNAAESLATTATVEVAVVKPLVAAVALEAVGSTNAIRLNWKHPDPAGVVGYMVMRAPTAQGPFTTVSTVTESSYTDEPLQLNESYYYKVITIGQGGAASEPTAVVQGATSVAPAAPIFMNVEPILAGAILTWHQRPCSSTDARSIPQGVRIYRRTAAEKEFSPVGRAGNEPALFRDQGLLDATTYLYVITAVNQAGAESERSVQLSVTTPPATAGLTARSGKVRRIELSWQVHPFGAVSGYRIQRATAQEGVYQDLVTLNERSQTSYLDTGLADNTTYWYRISAFCKELGTGGYSAAVAATTRDLPPVPIKLTAGQGEPRRVTLSWETTATADDELKGFYLYRGEPGQEKLVKIAELSADKRNYRDDSEPLKDAASYSYVIAAFNAGGAVSPLSARANATTKAVPAMPQGVQASSGEPRRVTLRWQRNPEKDIAEYIVFRLRESGDFKELRRTAETMLVDAELKDGTAYQYRLQAVDRDGLLGPFCQSVTGTTKPLPKVVEGLAVKDRATRLIAWQKSAQADVKRYHVYKKGFLGGQKLATVDATEWRVVEPGKLELYVTAEDADGLESEPSTGIAVE